MKKTATFFVFLMLLNFSSALAVSDVINLKDYATDGQGTYENPYTGNFQQAFDDMKANGTPLYVPYYHFALSNSIAIQGANNVKIYGEGKFLFNNITAFVIQDSESLLIRDLQFNGMSGQSSKAIEIMDSLYIRISDCSFLNVQVGVNTLNGNQNEIMVKNSLFETTNILNSVAIRYDNYDNYVSGNIIRGFDTGIYLDQHGGSALVDSNHIYKWPSSSYSYGLYSYKASNVTVINNHFDNPSVASIAFKDAYNMTIMGNKFQHTLDAPYIKFEQQYYTNANRMSIVSNLFKSSSPVTRSIEYPSEDFINTSSKHYIRDNVFDANSPYIATNSSKMGVMPAGAQQVEIDFSDKLAGSVGVAFAMGFNSEMSSLYVGLYGSKVKVYSAAPVSGDRWFNVLAQSKCVRD